MISSLKIKLNRSWKFQRNWKMPLVLLERSWWGGFNGIYLVRFAFRMWEILLIFKWFLLLKIQINSKKSGFGKEKSVEDVITCVPMAQATLVVYIFIGFQGKTWKWKKFCWCAFCKVTPMQALDLSSSVDNLFKSGNCLVEKNTFSKFSQKVEIKKR
jgi:hypothetical protein